MNCYLHRFSLGRKAAHAAIFLLLAEAFASPLVGQTVRLDPVLKDGSTELATQVAAAFEGPSASKTRQVDIEPVAMGFFTWKVMALTRLGVISKVGGVHIDVCRIIIGLYDNEIDSTLTSISSQGKSVTEFVELSEQEKSAVQKFVVQKISGKYNGLPDTLAGRTPRQFSPKVKWQFDAASALGEISGSLILWYAFPNNSRYDESVADSLARLKKLAADSPAGVDQRLVAALNSLAAMGEKQRQFDYPARLRVAEAFRAATALLIPPASTANSVEAIVHPPKPTALSLVAQGRKLAEAGSYTEAIVRYGQAVAIDPNEPQVYYYRSLANQQLRKLDAAIEDASTAIRLKYSLANAYLNRGTFYYEKQAYAAAKSDFDQSVRLGGTNTDAIYRRGLSALKLGELDSSLADFSTTIKLDPKYVNAFVRRAEVWCRKKLPMAAILDQRDAIKLGAKIPLGCSPQ